MIKTYYLLIVALFLAIPAYAANEIVIASNGKSTFTIVVPQRRQFTLSNAARELQLDIDLATQAKLEIKNDNDIDVHATNIISLGATRQAQAAGITATDIADEGFKIVTRGGNLYILGPDTLPGKYAKYGGTSTGTANGVYSFLEKYLQVRWLMPGDLGRDVPRIKTFALPAINHAEVPAFNLRQLPYIQESLPAVKSWEEHQKLRYYSMNLEYQHIWKKMVPESMYKDHPEWFALVNGTRSPRDSYYKLETTNPELVRYFADKSIAKLKANPNLSTASLSPSDNHGWSESPESKALYDPIPPGASYPSVTPLILKFYHDVAQIMAKEYPQGRLAGYIYQDYLYPPQQGSMKLPDNFTPMFAASTDYGFKLYNSEQRDKFTHLINDWMKVFPREWYFYDLPNTIMDGGVESRFQTASTGLVFPTGTKILDTIFPLIAKNHARGARIYGTPSWSNAAMSNYVLAQLMWNPRLNADTLQTEWLNRAYGPQAGSVMKQFYTKLQTAFEEYSQKELISWRLNNGYLQDIYGAHFPELEKVLLQASKCPMTSTQRQRFELIEDNLIVLQWRLRNNGYLKSTFQSQLQRSDAQISEIIQKNNPDFDLFPVIPERQERYVPSIKVQADKSAKPATAKRPPSFVLPDTYLFYAAQDGAMRIHCAQATQGSFFAYYKVRTTTDRRVLAKGIFYKNAAIDIPVKAGTAYYLTVPANAGISYRITISNAALAEGGMQQKTLHLYGKDAPIRFMSASRSSVVMQEKEGSVTIIKNLPNLSTEQLGKVQLQNTYQKVLFHQSLDADWRFQKDVTNKMQPTTITQLHFDDTSWKQVKATDWWQNQGFAGYRGPAWYRKTFSAPQLQGDQQLILYFGAIDGNSQIYLNGHKIAEHQVGDKSQNFAGWDQPITVNLTPQLQSGDNIIAVKVVSKEVGSSGIYNGAGLFIAEAK